MKHLFFCLLIFAAVSGFSQKKSEKAPPPFPSGWYGNWEGQLKIFGPQGLAMELPMELKISATDSAHRWNWTVIYHGKEDDVREYELVRVDSAKNHYVVDEKNSILLDSYYYQGVLCNSFSVDGTHLIVNYSWRNERIVMEIFVTNLKQAVETGADVEEVESVLSYPMSGRHEAVLKRRK